VEVIEEQETMMLRAELAASLADLQVSLARLLATRLKAAGVPDVRRLPLEAAVDQLEATAKQILGPLREGQMPTG